MPIKQNSFAVYFLNLGLAAFKKYLNLNREIGVLNILNKKIKEFVFEKI